MQGWWDGAAGLPLDAFGQVLSHGCFGKRSLSTQPVGMDSLDPISLELGAPNPFSGKKQQFLPISSGLWTTGWLAGCSKV